MYRILAFSDTHGYTDKCEAILKKIPQVDLVLHAGDIAADCRTLQKLHPNFQCVVGNNDLFCRDPREKMIEAAGKTIFLTHGHLYGVKSSLHRLAQHSKDLGADITVFGHTHRSFCGYENGVLLVNPGSSAGAYSDDASFAIIEIEDGKISADILRSGDFEL